MQNDPAVDASEWERRGIIADSAGHHAESEACFAQAIAADASRSIPWVGLAFSLIHQNRIEDAVASLRQAHANLPDCGIVGHLLNAMTGDASQRTPNDYITFLFNSYAGHFDSHIAGLQYQGPEMLAVLATRAGWIADGTRSIIDLGCGTGLSGLPFRGNASRLEGVDIATGMLQQAHLRGIYDHLWQGDLHEVLYQLPPAALDAVLAADTLLYIGAVGELFWLVHAALKPAGSFLLTVETCSEDYVLQPSGRYQHGDDYLQRCAGGLFTCEDRLDAPIRVEAGREMQGRAYRFSKIVH